MALGTPYFFHRNIAKAQESDEIKIGILHSLSGTIAIIETSLHNAELLAIEEINAKGGVLGKKLVPVVEDPQSLVLVPSVGSRGDSYDNALAESVIGLFKTEVIRHGGPWRGLDDVEYATLEWVAWFNTQRLLEPLGYLPPAEYEEQFHRTQIAQSVVGVLT
jgi:transposase InsO family protein